MHSRDLCWRLSLKVMNGTLEVQFCAPGQLGWRCLHHSQLPEQDSLLQKPAVRCIDPMCSPVLSGDQGSLGHDLSGRILTPVLGEKTLTCVPQHQKTCEVTRSHGCTSKQSEEPLLTVECTAKPVLSTRWRRWIKVIMGDSFRMVQVYR